MSFDLNVKNEDDGKKILSSSAPVAASAIKFLTRQLIGLISLNLLVFLIAFILLKGDRKSCEIRALTAAENLSLVLEHDIADSYEKVDISLQDAIDELAPILSGPHKDTTQIDAIISRIKKRLPILSGLRASDADGNMLYGMNKNDVVHVSISDRDYFKQLKNDKSTGLVISTPVKGRVTGTWSIVLARRITMQNGEFGGVAAATIPLDYFNSRFITLKLGTNGSIGLRDDSLRLIVRYPAPKGNLGIGSTKVAEEFTNALKDYPNIGSYSSGLSSLDGIQRIHSYRRNNTYGFIINAGFAYEDILTEWRLLVWRITALISLFVVVSVFYFRHLWRSWMNNQQINSIIQQSEAKFRSYIDNAPDGVFLADETGRYLEVNKAASSITGYSETELLNMSISDLLPFEYLDTGRLNFQQVKEKGSSSIELQFNHKDGSKHWWLVDAVKLSETRYLGFTKEITKRKLAEDQLIESLLFNQQVINCVQEGIVVHDSALYYKVWNPFMERMTGIQTADVIGKLPHEAFPFLEDIGVLGRLHKVLNGELVKTIEVNFQIPGSGKSGLTSDSCDPLINSNGDIIGVIQTVRDITESRKTEERLLQAEKMEAIGNLAGGVAHDFNNKLMVIMGNVALAQMEIDDKEKLLHYLEEILRAAEFSRDLTSTLLAFSRQQVVNPQCLNVNNIVAEILKSLTRLIGEHISITFVPRDGIWGILIDPVQLDQIIMNMAVNARDAMPNGGTFTLETHNVSNPEACISGEKRLSGDYVCMNFSDTGVGMDQETLSHIFEPFFTTKEVGKGTGLGLATIYGIVQQNKGCIDVTSIPGQGTTFKVYLPRHDTIATEATIPDNSIITGVGSILLVEDEDAVRSVTSRFLNNIGYTVYEADHPHKALELVRNLSIHIDLILTDFVMPEMNGKLMMDQILTIRPHIKYLYASGFSSDLAMLDDIASVSNKFVQKPYNLKKLSAQLNQIISNEQE